MTDYDKGWNDALQTAIRAIERAPVFKGSKYPDGDGPVAIAEKLSILSVCRAQLQKLVR